jgi:hypothetical protein
MLDTPYLIIMSLALIYARYYIVYKSHDIAFDAITLIPLLLFVVGGGIHIASFFIFWNFYTPTLTILYIGAYIYALYLITNLNPDQRDFINYDGPTILIQATILSIVYMSNIYNFPLMDTFVPFIMFLGTFVAYRDNFEENDTGSRFLCSILSLAAFYWAKNTIIYIGKILLNLVIIHSPVSLVSITLMAAGIFYFRVYVLSGELDIETLAENHPNLYALIEGLNPIYIHIAFSITSAIVYYILFLMIFYLFTYNF